MTAPRRAEILTIGDELLSGETVDTNANYLDGRLAAWGWQVQRHVTVADDVVAIAQALTEAAGRSDLVLTSGGLGPTEDDVTLEACARALGCPLRLDEAILERIAARFRSFGREMTPNNRRQALVPEVGEPLVNGSGTAPGFRCTLGDAQIFVLPGVPREVRWFVEHVLTSELDRGQPAVHRRTLRTVGIGESKLETEIADVVETYRNRVRFGYRAIGMETHIKLAVGTAPGGGVELLDAVEIALRSVLGDAIFGRDDTDLIAALAERLLARGATVATAESCTGGLLGKLLTDRAGSSEYYRGGCVTYSDDAKVVLLGVDEVDLEVHGAVSERIVQQMAKGVRKRLHADWGLAISGIAGPDGGTKDKPVGTVWIAMAGPDRLQSKRLQLAGDREMVRTNAAKILLDWLRRGLPAA